ncbi:MAG: DUF3500 domain-containing protein [Lapillicoccus sp.]
MADDAHPDTAAGRRELATGMAEAAAVWLDSLSAEQRATAHGHIPAYDETDSERRRWFYTPTDHGGLTLHQQGPAQQRHAMRLVASGLSEAGFVTVATTMGLENVLDRHEGFRVDFDRERGRDPGMYYLRVFGEPGGDAPWGWRFGGHHVSLNHLVVDGKVVSTTPCFMGADPASSPLLGGAVNRPLGRVEDLARELVRSLSPDLAARAILRPPAPSDLVTTNRSSLLADNRSTRHTGIWRDSRPSDRVEPDHPDLTYTETPKGVPASTLDRGQRDTLRALLSTYFGRVPDAVSPMLGYASDATLDAVHLAWAGPTEPGAPHYYRIQGPGLLLEWDNTQRDANHAHSVWRDPGADFGLDVLAQHRRLQHRSDR